MEKFVGARGGGLPSAHTILRTVTRRPPCILNRPSLHHCSEKRGPAHLRAGLRAGRLAAARDRRTQPGAPCAQPEDWPLGWPAVQAAPVPRAQARPHRGARLHPEGRCAGPSPRTRSPVGAGDPPGPGGPGGSWRPWVWLPISGPNMRTWGVHVEILSTLRRFLQFLHHQEVK